MTDDMMDNLPAKDQKALDAGLGRICQVASRFEKNDPAVVGKTLDVSELQIFDEDTVSVVTVIERVDPDNAEERVEEMLNQLGHEGAMDR